MATSTFPTVTTGVTVQSATNGAINGDGSAGNKLAVGVDGVTIDVNGSNQLEVIGGAEPGGSDTQVQFNDAGSFGGDADLTWNPAAEDGVFHVGVADGDLPARVQEFWGDAQQSIFCTRADSTGLAIVFAPESGSGQGAIGAVAYGPDAVAVNCDAVGTTNDTVNGVLAGTALDGAAVTAGVGAAVHVVNASVSNSAVMDIQYGLLIDNLTRATTNYAIKTGTGLLSWGDVESLKAFVFADLPLSPVAGMMAYITDADTVTWGATISGSDTNKVLAWYNGTNWTVAGK